MVLHKINLYCLEIITLSAIFIGSFCNIILLKAGGLNLRLQTIAIVFYLVVRRDSVNNILRFIYKNGELAIIFLTYLLILFIPAFWAEISFLVIKQCILMLILTLNIFYFASIKMRLDKFAIVFMLMVLASALLVNIYCVVKPIWHLYRGSFSILMMRPSGFFEIDNVNLFGQCHVMITGYIFGAFLCESLSTKIKKLAVFALLIQIPIFVVANNRASYIAILFQIMLIFTALYRYSRQARLRLALVFSLIIFSSVAILPLTVYLPSVHIGYETQYDYIADRFVGLFKGKMYSETSGGGYEGAIQTRIDGLNTALTQFEKSPFFGVGLANSALGNAAYDSEVTEIRQSNENMFIDIMAESGLFGIVFFTLVYGNILTYAYINIKKHNNSPAFACAVGSFLAISGMLVNGLSISPLTQHVFWINIGVVFYLWKSNPIMPLRIL